LSHALQEPGCVEIGSLKMIDASAIQALSSIASIRVHSWFLLLLRGLTFQQQL
jgi:hypothetical protein